MKSSGFFVVVFLHLPHDSISLTLSLTHSLSPTHVSSTMSSADVPNAEAQLCSERIGNLDSHLSALAPKHLD